MRQDRQQQQRAQQGLILQQSVRLSGTSDFGRDWVCSKGAIWSVKKITDHVLFSTNPGPWLLLEHNHIQRWINLSNDRHFLISWTVRSG